MNQLSISFSSVRETSRSAYRELKSSGQVGAQARLIRDWIEQRGSPASLQEISKGTGIAINAVSGRVNDCKESGLLFEYPKRPCTITGRTVMPVYVVRGGDS